jgi:phosphotransferase system  glucose/maltose/N-acetylglucosamine-specific IIC component
MIDVLAVIMEDLIMVKKAEKDNKRSPLLPIFGLLLAGGLLAASYAITTLVVLKAGNFISNSVIKVIGNNSPTSYTIAFTIAIWVALLAVAYFLVAVMIGKDPNDKDAIPLPPKNKKEKTFKRR